MTIISSQHHIDWDIVSQKMEEIKGLDCVEIPCWDIGEIDGVEYAIQADRHHTAAAARELGIQVEYVHSDEPDGLSGENALDAHWNDGDWYCCESSRPEYEEYDFVW